MAIIAQYISASQLLCYVNIFSFQESNGKPVRVIVKGKPASWNTTFVEKICQEWAMLHARSEEPVSSEIRETLGQYDLLIPIILHLVKKGATLEQTIQDQIELNEKKMYTLRYMLKKKENTVLIFHALDVYNTKRSPKITDIMKGNTFKHVIITSRAEAVNKTQKWKQIMYKEAELKGFSDESIKLYVDKFFKTSKELVSSLVSHIFHKGSNLLELARNPDSLCMLCILHKDKIPIYAMNREQLYQEYVAFRLSRWEQRQNPEGEKTPRSEILKKYHTVLLKFGELANSDTDNLSADNDIIDDDDDDDDDDDNDDDDDDSKELSYTLNQIKSVIGEDALNYGYLYKSYLSSHLLSSRYLFINKTLHEFFLAYFIKHYHLESFKERLYKKRDFVGEMLSLTRFLLHLYMSPEQALEFTTNIIGSKPDKNLFKGVFNIFRSTQTEPHDTPGLFSFIFKLYQGYQHDEYQTTLTFNATEDIFGSSYEYSYIYQYPCYVIRAHRRHHDSLSSYNKDIIRRMNTDNKHKAVTVPLLQTASIQLITCGYILSDFELCVYCRPDYEVALTGVEGKLKELHLNNIEKMGDINLNPVNDRLSLDIYNTNLHGCVGLTKPWMAFIMSLKMEKCKLEAGDISVIADSIQACTSPTGPESASLCRLMELHLGNNSLTGSGADIARIIPLCTKINLEECKLEAGDISVIADNILAITSPAGVESASPCRIKWIKWLNLRFNSLTGAGGDIARIIPLFTRIDLGRCKLEAGDISVIADSIQACTSPIGAESASPCRLQMLDLFGNSLTGAGADIARIISCIPLCTQISLNVCDLNDEDFHAIVNAIIQSHSDRHTSVHDHSTPDRRQTSRLTSFWNEFIKYVKPANPGPASHIEDLGLWKNKFSDVETVRLLCDNLPPSLRWLELYENQFNEEEIEEIRRTYKNKHPNLDLWI